MGIRDNEILRLKKYAEGLGIKVIFKKYTKGVGGAEWDMEDRIITLYTSKDDNKTTLILAFLHELGHHLDWVYKNKKLTKQSFKAFELLNAGPIYGERLDIPKKYRDIIYEEEKSGVYYMDIIHRELDLKIPLWKVKMAQDTDLMDYESLSKTGRFLTTKEVRSYRKLNKKYYIERYGY